MVLNLLNNMMNFLFCWQHVGTLQEMSSETVFLKKKKTLQLMLELAAE